MTPFDLCRRSKRVLADVSEILFFETDGKDLWTYKRRGLRGPSKLYELEEILPIAVASPQVDHRHQADLFH